MVCNRLPESSQASERKSTTSSPIRHIIEPDSDDEDEGISIGAIDYHLLDDAPTQAVPYYDSTQIELELAHIYESFPGSRSGDGSSIQMQNNDTLQPAHSIQSNISSNNGHLYQQVASYDTDDQFSHRTARVSIVHNMAADTRCSNNDAACSLQMEKTNSESIAVSNLQQKHSKLPSNDEQGPTSSNDEQGKHDMVVDTECVLSAMSGFTLPSSAIPPWAANIPESEWNSFLLNRIRDGQNE